MIRLTVALVAIIGCAAGEPSRADLTTEIAAMLDASADAWNRHDLDAFVGDYAPESTTTFVYDGQVQHGFQWIREHYAPSFAPDAVHDQLRFKDLEARPIGTDYALATARYVLLRGDSITSSGLFTLVLQKMNGAWKIIHDQTSRDK